MQSLPVNSLMPKTTVASNSASDGASIANGVAASDAGQQDFSAILLAQLLGGLSVSVSDALPVIEEKAFYLNGFDPDLKSAGNLAEDEGQPVSPDAALFVFPLFADKSVNTHPEISEPKSELLLDVSSRKAESGVVAEFAASGKSFQGLAGMTLVTDKSGDLAGGDKAPGIILAASADRDGVETDKFVPDFALATVDSRQLDLSKNLLASAENQPVSTPMARLSAEAPVAQPIEGKSTVLAIPQPVGHSAWGESFGQKVVWMVGQQQQVAELKLNPPHLGPMEVRLTVQNDQVTAQFVSHNAAVRESIEAAMPRLREMFAESGMTLGNAMVGSESFSRQQASGQDQGSNAPSTFSPELSSFSEDSILHQGVLTLRPDGGGRLDFFV
jgi:hypothetical protein